MSFQNSALVRDNSTLANFKSWASTISAFFTTAGWVQSSDTGQVNWSTIASVPGAGSYVYEIWKPGDALTAFYLKVEYGTNTASTNTGPSLRVSIGTSTNGAGTLTGFVTIVQLMPSTATAVDSTVTQWQCYFSGDSGRMGVMMWRDDTGNPGPICFVVQRSLNSSGTPTSSYVTLLGCGNSGNSQAAQQSVVFGVGVSNALQFGTAAAGWITLRNFQITSDAFNSNIPISPVFPSIGYYDNPMDAAAVGSPSDFTEGTPYTIAAANMPYGVSHTYIASKNAPLTHACHSSIGCALLMRYD